MHIYLWSTLCFETKIAQICPVRKYDKEFTAENVEGAEAQMAK